jgi:hypothetical protein
MTQPPAPLPRLGLGIGWRPELALAIDRRQDLGFVEVIAENLDPAEPIPAPIRALQARGVRVIPHGVSLSLGGAEPVDTARVDRLARLAERLDAPLVSEHICFVRADGIESGHLLPPSSGRRRTGTRRGSADGIESGHLLPLPRTRQALDVLVENVLEAKRRLPVPLALENIATLFDWPAREMGEGEFVAEALRRTDTLLLLDVANVWANARNRGGDPVAVLSELPLDRLAYTHVAGGAERDGVYHDTHANPTPPGVLDLLADLSALADPPGVMLERDEAFPPEAELHRELDAIAAAAARGRARRRGGGHGG